MKPSAMDSLWSDARTKWRAFPSQCNADVLRFYPEGVGELFCLPSKCSLHLRCSWLSSAIKRIWKHVSTSEWSLALVQLLRSLCLTLIFVSPLPHVPDHPALIPDAKMSTISYVVIFVSISFSEPCSSLRRTVL